VVDREHRRPDIAGVTVFANIARLHVRGALARGFGAVVAAEAVACNIDVIEIGRQPRDGCVAVVAIVATGDMRRVFSRCRDAVMTGTASTGYLCVVDSIDGRPYVGAMAVLADIRRLYVSQVLARGFRAVMATDAVAGDVYVIEVRGPPGNRRVTIVASIVTGDVRRMFADCRDAVMAGATGADHLRMVDRKNGHEHIRAVTVLANVTGLHMLWVLAGRFHAVVAVDAIAGDVHVIEIRWKPASRRMTVVAGIAAGYVRLVLAGRSDAVMTGAASANDLCVVDCVDRRKHVRVVAVFTDVAGLNMHRILAHGVCSVVATEAIISDVDVIEGCG